MHSGLAPTHPGEPTNRESASDFLGVYPRECGGTVYWETHHLFYEGLSPRVRGNHDLVSLFVLFQRSIPASAGEPASTNTSSQNQSVYPRECGGTCFRPGILSIVLGLSPRVRGNRRRPLQKLPATYHTRANSLPILR